MVAETANTVAYCFAASAIPSHFWYYQAINCVVLPLHDLCKVAVI